MDQSIVRSRFQSSYTFTKLNIKCLTSEILNIFRLCARLTNAFYSFVVCKIVVVFAIPRIDHLKSETLMFNVNPKPNDVALLDKPIWLLHKIHLFSIRKLHDSNAFWSRKSKRKSRVLMICLLAVGTAKWQPCFFARRTIHLCRTFYYFDWY